MNRILLTVMMVVFCYNISAQDYDYYTTIQSPTNVSIEAQHLVEFSVPQLAEIEAEAAGWINDYNSNAERVAPASRTYNCHNYAWNSSDGGGNFWVNQYDYYWDENLSKYWTGNSSTYQQISNLKATKVFYSDGDHSAVVISPTLFESKWGDWPRYRHAPTDITPYTSTNLQYYWVPVSGDDLICSSESYSTLNISGASYSWDGSRVSLSGSGYSTDATKTSDGSGWIQVQISSPYSGTTVTSIKTIWLGVPSQPTGINNFFNNGKEFGSDSDYEFRVNCSNAQGIDDYEWVVSGGTITAGQGTNIITVHTDEVLDGSEYFNVTVRTGNDCGWSSYFERTGYVVPGSGGGQKFVVYPNPSTSMITVSVAISNKIQKSGSNTGDELSVSSLEVFDNYGVKIKSNQFGTGVLTTTLDISSLRPGIYQIRIHYGNKEETHTLIKK